MIHVPNNFHSPVSAFIHEGKLNIPENFQEHFPEIWQIIQSCSIPLIETSDKLVWSLQQMVTFILIAFFKVLELMFRLPCFGIKLFLLGQFFLVNFFILSYLLKIYFKKKRLSASLLLLSLPYIILPGKHRSYFLELCFQSDNLALVLCHLQDSSSEFFQY